MFKMRFTGNTTVFALLWIFVALIVGSFNMLVWAVTGLLHLMIALMRLVA